jgi:NADH:ubiquinone oxidoreductase subunit 3 (subunit A)
MPDVLVPPIAFIVVLLAALGLHFLMGRLSYKPAPGNEANRKPYACGENGHTLVRPDYGQVFPFAFYFTILHVVALVATTVPDGSPSTLTMALIYVFSAVVGLFVLYRR